MTETAVRLRSLFPLDPDAAYLNHGAYGVVPHTVSVAQAAWRERIEAAPGPFFARECAPALRAALDAVAPRLGAEGADTAFVDNVTGGFNGLLRSLDLKPGDEILLGRHGYGAFRNAALFAASRTGAVVVEADTPFPVTDARTMGGVFAAAMTDRTRLVVVDHVGSSTAVAWPVEEVVAACRREGVVVAVDGAHAPGHVPVDVARIGADVYLANLHKWAFAPRGTGVLWASKAVQEWLHPAVVSWGYGKGFAAEFDWTGTRDVSGWLAAPEGFALHERLGGGALMARNRGLATGAGDMLADAWGTRCGGPPRITAAMRCVQLPEIDVPGTPDGVSALRARLWDQHRIEAPVYLHDGALWVRIAAQAYNELEDFVRLRDAVEGMRPARRQLAVVRRRSIVPVGAAA